jgi:hypothetical protein
MIARLLLVGCVVSFAAGAASVAHAAHDGASLLAECRSYLELDSLLETATDEDDRLDIALAAQACMTYLMGIIDSNDFYSRLLINWRENGTLEVSPIGIVFCLPEGFTAADASRAVVEYLAARPDELDENDFIVAFESLRDRYPCK